MLTAMYIASAYGCTFACIALVSRRSESRFGLGLTGVQKNTSGDSWKNAASFRI